MTAAAQPLSKCMILNMDTCKNNYSNHPNECFWLLVGIDRISLKEVRLYANCPNQN